MLGDDALAVLRDLKRWLKLYDEKTNRLDVARCLAEASLVRGDLLPILATWKEDKKNDKLRARAALACLELLVPLTWPLEHEEMTLNHHRHTPYIQQAQVKYKAAILHWDGVNVLRQAVRIGLPSIAMKREERTTRDEGIIKLMLYLLRNIAAIRQIPNLPSQGLDNEVSRSATIDAFREQDVFALLLTMCSNMGEDFDQQDVILLEILFNLIKGVDVQKLWMTESQRKGQEVSDLKATLIAEDGLHKDAKKKEWSRHGRFGTMIWVKQADEKLSAVSGQDNLKDSRTALFNMDNTKKWNKPIQKRKDLDHTIHDFDSTEHLSASANEKLRNFVEEFLDSGFNPLFTHLRKAIEREAERILPINYRQFFYAVSWFLQAERVRREKQKKEAKPTNVAKDFEPESYALVAAVLNQETFITLNRYMQMAYDEKAWSDLNASMRCFTQVLLTVQDMSQSPLDEDQEIADNIQNRIFYEETTHDRVRDLLKVYKDQGLGYLDACTELAHVFLRMLERYSKENVDLQIRSKRKARRKQKEGQKQKSSEGTENNEDEGEESENEDLIDAAKVSKERKFDFQRFAAKFVTQSTVDTFVAFTSFYRDLSVEQLKRAHRFFYRAAFKQDMAVLLYRVDITALFYRMTEGPEGLSKKHPTYSEWSEFSKQLFRKLFKKIDQRPELIIEMLFSKINNTLYYLEFGREKQTLTSTRAPAELEIRSAPGRDRKEQIGIVVTILRKDDKSSLVTWVKDIVCKAYDERQSWEAEAEARAEAANSEANRDGEQQSVAEMPIAKPSYITARATSDDIETAIFKNARLKLLMKLVGFKMLGNEDVLGATWIVPSEVTASHLEESKNAIEQHEKQPWESANPDEAPEDMLRRTRKETVQPLDEDEEARRDAFIDDSEGNDDVDDEAFMFPDNIRAKTKKRDLLEQLKAKRRKRKRDEDGSQEDEVDDELAAERRRRREENALARRRKIKSNLYIRESDDESDAEADLEFFRKEEELRKRHDGQIRKQMALDRSTAADKSKRSKKAKISVTMDNDDELMLDADDAEDTAPSSEPLQRSDSESQNEDEAEETPISSPIQNDGTTETALKEMRQARINTSHHKGQIEQAELDSGSEQEEDEVITLPQRRGIRGGFVIDDDDDE